MTTFTLAIRTGLPNYKEKNLTRRLHAELDLPKLFKQVDKLHEFSGARIVYIDHEFTSVLLREFQPTCRKNPITLVLREPPRQLTMPEYAASLRQNKRDSEIVGEMVGSSLSCGAAVLSWIVVIGAFGAIPLSGGASTAVTYLGYAAAAASTAQCFNGLARTALELGNPELKDWLDSQAWYTNAALAVDALSLAGIGASGVVLAKTLKVTRAASSKSTVDILRGLSRAERKRLTTEIIKLNHPGVSSKVMKTLIGAGKYPKRYAHGQISEALALKVKEAIGASFSFAGSASSGAARSLAVGLHEATMTDD